jgi:hypothetical protein
MKTYEVRKKYLAEALSYLGFRYYKFDEPEYTSYSFDDTEQFREALKDMLRLKNKYSSYCIHK